MFCPYPGCGVENPSPTHYKEAHCVSKQVVANLGVKRVKPRATKSVTCDGFTITTVNGVARFMCKDKQCTSTFKTAVNANGHYEKVHLKMERYKCNYCGEKFVYHNYIKRHLMKCLEYGKYLDSTKS